MKIKVIHDECGRESLVQQILQSQGHCPWDGRPFNKDYTAVLAEALETAENAGTVLQTALEAIAGMNSEMALDADSILGPLVEQIERLNAARARTRR